MAKTSIRRLPINADFITTVTNRHTLERLAEAIAGKRPFRRFKDALSDYPQERERWFAFSAERQRQRAADWLEAIGIKPVEKELSAATGSDTAPSTRSI